MHHSRESTHLVSLNVDTEDSLAVYKANFEKAYIEDTEKFYMSRASQVFFASFLSEIKYFEFGWSSVFDTITSILDVSLRRRTELYDICR